MKLKLVVILARQMKKKALVSMTDFWKKAPVGGEFTSSLSMEEMLEASLSQTVEMIRESHTTFLGPNAANPGFCRDMKLF